jgi:DNA-binding XRE family transcriptional regulator
MSSEQIKELQKNLKKDRENLRKVALVLRKKNKSQEEVAAILGVPRTTLEGWEQGQITTIDESVIGCNPPDLRIKVPKKEYETIYQRVEDIRAYGLASMLSLSLDC